MPHRFAPLLLAAIAIAACSSGAGASGTPTVNAPTATAPTAAPPGTPLVTAGPTLEPTVEPRPSGTAPWPTAFDIELVAGTYWSSPPFSVPFSITISEPGWYSGHLHAAFIDIQRFDGITPHQFPNRMLGFGIAEEVHGGDGDVDATELTPDAAFDLLAARGSLTTSNRTTIDLLGITGRRMDVHSPTNNNPLFGTEDGAFGLGPELDVRLVLLPLDGQFLVVAVLAEPKDLDAAWEHALPMLGTVQLGA